MTDFNKPNIFLFSFSFNRERATISWRAQVSDLVIFFLIIYLKKKTTDSISYWMGIRKTSGNAPFFLETRGGEIQNFYLRTLPLLFDKYHCGNLVGNTCQYPSAPTWVSSVSPTINQCLDLAKNDEREHSLGFTLDSYWLCHLQMVCVKQGHGKD